MAKQPTDKQSKILATKKDQPQLTTRQIAKVCDTNHSYVVETLKRYQLNHKSIEEYRRARGDIWLATEAAIMQNITSEDIQKEPMRNKIVAAGICADKIRDITGGAREVTPMVIVNRISIDSKPVDNSDIITVDNCDSL